MQLNVTDILVFLAFIICVVGVGLLKSRKEKTSEDYFLAGRGLSWWLIGFSLIAANISTEQFVGMSGQAANYVGLAIASYEWLASITLVVVAFFFLPKFLSCGIYTIPEFLQYRYNEMSRTIMAVFTMIIYVGVTIAAVIYSGALMIDTLFYGQVVLGMPINVVTASWIIGIIAAIYVACGGLKACAWADLIQGSALMIGGGIITYFAFKTLGATPINELATSAAPEVMKGLSDSASGITKFFALNQDKLHMKLPRTDIILPWTALVVGLWIPNFYYWGLNQYITQRTLGSKSLAQGQKGIVFAAFLKLIIPFVIVVPGIIAFNLYSGNMQAEAAKDNSPVISKYLKANPQTQLVDVVDSPADETVVAWPAGRFMIALYSSEDDLKAVKVKNPFVLPIVESQYNGLTVKENTVFKSDDKSWETAFPALAAEIKVYNEGVEQAAKAAQKPISAEKIIAYKYDSAFALLIGKLVPIGTRGFILAAIFGAVVSSLASMLNSASTIFTMDLYSKYIHKTASQANLVAVGRICVGVFVVIGCMISPILASPKFGGIFTYIQEFQGFISPGILAVFVFGFIVRKAPAVCGVVGLLINPLVYLVLKYALPKLAFLDRMAASFGCVLLIMYIITLINPLHEPIQLPKKTDIELKSSPLAKVMGIVVVVLTLILYAVFW